MTRRDTLAQATPEGRAVVAGKKPPPERTLRRSRQPGPGPRDIKVDTYKGVQVYLTKDRRNFVAWVSGVKVDATSWLGIQPKIRQQLDALAGTIPMEGLTVVYSAHPPLPEGRTDWDKPSRWYAGRIRCRVPNPRQNLAHPSAYQYEVLAEGERQVHIVDAEDVWVGKLADARRLNRLERAKGKAEREFRRAQRELIALKAADYETITKVIESAKRAARRKR